MPDLSKFRLDSVFDTARDWGDSSDVWRSRIGLADLPLSLSAGARRPRSRPEHDHISAGQKRHRRDEKGDNGSGCRSGWVDDVEEMHKHCVSTGLTDYWVIREKTEYQVRGVHDRMFGI